MSDKKYIHVCPNCGNIKHYSCIQSYCAGKKKKKCNKCKEIFFIKWKKELSAEEYDRRMNEYKEKQRKNSSGKNNKMYGISIYDIWLEKYGKKEADKRKKKHADNSRKNNAKGMTGRSVYSVWLEKYGKKEADRKMQSTKRKLSKASSGKNNAMYGKPSPCGSGNGWKGWYKDWYFRSLRELIYLVNVIEKNNWNWTSGENSKYYIKYKAYTGNDRTYRADFIINDSIMVEIKPIKLHKTPNILRKKEAAEVFCKSHGMTYQLIDISVDYQTVFDLYNRGEIIMQGIYDKKMKEYIKIKENVKK